MQLPRWLLLFFFFQLWLFSTAQQFGFIHHSIEDGLAQSQVRSIAQDSRGYLWFATMGGVSRFDGQHYQNYSASDGLADNQVNCIFESADQRLWFGCIGGLSVFDGTSFVSYALGPDYENAMVLDIAEIAEDQLLLATNGSGLLIFDKNTGLVVRQSAVAPDGFIRRLIILPSGDLLIGARSGLLRITERGLGKTEVVLSDVSVSDIVAGKDDIIWVSTFGSGIHRLNNDENLHITEDDGLQNNFVREIIADQGGNLWVASRSGLNKLTPDGAPVFTANIGLNYDNIKTLFIDREQNLWVGTDGKGVYRFTGERFVTFSRKDSLVSDIVMAIERDKSGNLWFGSYDNGACKMDASGKVTSYNTGSGLLHQTIWCMKTDRRGDVWMGTNIGVSRYSAGQFINYTGAETGALFDRVTAVHEAANGWMWFGVVNGIAAYNGERFLRADELPDFPGRRVRHIFESSGGQLFFGAENGLVVSDGTDFKLIELPGKERNNVIYSITEDDQGRIWIGAKRGLYYFDDNQFNALVFSNGFGSNTINFLAHDDGVLYVGTNNGLFALDTKYFEENRQPRIEHFTDQEGLPSLECNQNAVFLDQENYLWFGTTEGVIRYNTELNPFETTRYEPIVKIKSVKLILQESNWRDFADSIDTGTGLPVHLELSHKNNHLTFEFAGLYYTNPSKVEFQYMLEGVDENWLPPTSTNYATYASLRHGDYTFKVRGRIAGSDWSDTYDSFSFAILPPFYFTWWFILISAAFTLLIISLIIRAILQAEARKRATQQLVYTSRMLALEQQTLNSSMNRHFIFNALNSIQYYINRQDKLSANKYLSSFARLIRKNLDSSQSNFTSLADELERIELYLSLENMRFPDKFEYQIHIDPALDTHQVKIPAMLFQPYLENSIWHGILPKKEKGRITLEVKQKGNDIGISISDDGIGLEKSLQSKQQTGSSHIPQGMLINKNRIDLFRKMTNQNFDIDGPKEVKNPDGSCAGTVVEITFPLKSDVDSGLKT